MVIELNEQNFESEVLKSDVPVLVDFWAPWCGPCHIVSPVLDKLAGEYAGRVKFAKVNVDGNQELARRYNVMSIPMLVLFKGGSQVDSLLGAVPEGSIRQKVDALL